MKDFSKNIIDDRKSVKEALDILNTINFKDSLTLFVVNEVQQLLGTLTDGDVRRGLLAGKNINEPVSAFMHKSYKYLEDNKYNPQEVNDFKKEEIKLVPILSVDRRIVKIIDLSDKKSILPIDFVIMAGGEGKRLRPLTEKTPKPLLRVGPKPIIEHNVDRLYSYGVNNIYISINYLGDQLIDYFGDGSTRGLNIQYIREESSLGTIGSVSLVEDFPHEYVAVMNSDLLTNIDFEDFFKSFLSKNADMMVATIPYRVDIPYGVLETQNDFIVSFKEKPSYTFYSNAGIYIFKKAVLNSIPKRQFHNATDLMANLIADKANLMYYPILGYWLDIGQMEDYKKAQRDFEHITF